MPKDDDKKSGNPKEDFQSGQRSLVSFESGHYKTVTGHWKGDSVVWTHFKKTDGGMVHVNKDLVEYIETWPL